MKIKNLFLGLTTLAVVASPIVATISCGKNDSEVSPPSATILNIGTKIVNQIEIDAFISGWNDNQSATEKIADLSTIFSVNIQEQDINNFSVNINSQANPHYVELTANVGFAFLGNNKNN